MRDNSSIPERWIIRGEGSWVVARRNNLYIVPPAYTGVAFLLSWIYLLFYANSAGIEAAAPISLMSAGYTVSATCMVATLLVVAFLPLDVGALLTLNATKVVVPLGLSAGTVLMIMGGFGFGGALTWVGGVCTGVFSGIMAQQWIVAYRRVGLKDAINSFPMLTAIAVSMCLTMMYLPRIILLTATVAFPLVSGFLFHVVRKSPQPVFEEEPRERDSVVNFALLLLPFAVCSLGSGFLDFSSADNNYTFVFYALVAFIPLIVAGAHIFMVEREGFLLLFGVPLAFLTVVFVPFFTLSGLVPLAHFVSIGELGIEVLVFIVVVGFADFFSLDALKTYAFGRAVVTLFNYFGWYAAFYLEGAWGALFNSQVSLLIVFIAVEVLSVGLIVAIIKAQKNIGPDKADGCAAFERSEDKLAVSVPSRSEVAGETEKAHGGLQAACRRIGEEHGLSKRELDVFVLLARGYASASIQKELYIAAGTANYHTRNIYAKLGVHSRSEVIELVNAKAEDG